MKLLTIALAATVIGGGSVTAGVGESQPVQVVDAIEDQLDSWESDLASTLHRLENAFVAECGYRGLRSR
jgi:hypothetical protein